VKSEERKKGEKIHRPGGGDGGACLPRPGRRSYLESSRPRKESKKELRGEGERRKVGYFVTFFRGKRGKGKRRRRARIGVVPRGDLDC